MNTNEGTGFIEIKDDLPEPDRYRAASDLARMLTERGEDLGELGEHIGLASDDPADWEALDIARAASFARHHHRDGFDRLRAAYPWLEAAADSSAHDALGSLTDRFLGQ